MLGMLEWLIPDSTRKVLTPVDWLLTVLAIYLHDLGLVVTTQEFDERNNNPEFVAWFASLSTNIEGREFLGRTRRMNGEEKHRFFFQEYVRKGHAARIREWITGRNSTKWGPQVRPLASAVEELLRPLLPRFREHLGVVCESHHDDNLHLLTRYPLAAGLGTHPQEIVNVQYAAILLRSADLLHVTKDRTPSVMYQTIKFSDPKSVAEWEKQRHTFSVRAMGRGLDETDPESAVILIGADFLEEGPYFALQEYVTYADNQIQQSKRWIDESQESRDGKDYRFPWRRVKADVQLDGAEPIPLKFELDRGRLLSLLVGHTIYNDPMVAVRELMQNGIDAGRYQNYLDTRKARAEGNTPPPLGKVVVQWDSAERLLTVEDSGTGMTRSIIDNHLMRVGVSFYDSVPVLTEHRDFSPISRFGIGILTCFMVSDDIEVITCREGKAHRLRMTQVQSDYALRELFQGDPKLLGLEPHGTRVTLRVRESVDLAERSIEDILRHWIILPECTVEYVEDKKCPIRIGFDSPSAAVTYFGGLDTVSTDPDSLYEVIVKNLSESEEFEGGPIQVRYDLAFAVRKSLLPERAFATTERPGLPVVCIEGIRVADSLPGFSNAQQNRYSAVLSVCGSRRFRTTVSRSGLEVDEKYNRVGEVCAQLLFEHATDEVAHIVAGPGRPVSQASSAFRWLYSQISNQADTRTGQYLFSLRNEFSCIVGETGEVGAGKPFTPRVLLSPAQLSRLPEFWTIESRLLDSLGTISRDIGRELSLFEFISTLAPNLSYLRRSPILPDPALAKYDFMDSHCPGSVEFSRQHQYSAIRWVPTSRREAVLDVRTGCSQEFFAAARERLRKVDSGLYLESKRANYRFLVFEASLEGDFDKIQAVGGRTCAIVQPGSKAQEWWMALRRHIREIVATDREPGQLADAMAIAIAYYCWVSQIDGPYGRKPESMWATAWASVSDHTRSALALPHSPSEIVASDAIFSARSYWRNWFDFD